MLKSVNCAGCECTFPTVFFLVLGFQKNSCPIYSNGFQDVVSGSVRGPGFSVDF